MKTKIILFIAVSLFLVNVGYSSKEQLKESRDSVTIYEYQYKDEADSIELNHGEKWKVDANMLLHIRNMESDVFSFSPEKEDYRTLTKNLRTNLDLLTSNCTMTGQAHDELHKWLLPYIDRVQTLSKAKGETEMATKFQHIKNSFIVFNQYFQ